MGGLGVPTEHPGGNGSANGDRENTNGDIPTSRVSTEETPVTPPPERRGIIVGGANDGTEETKTSFWQRLREVVGLDK
ncbi:MAG: hypothetical protein WC873_02620 [Candidatus Gracilibacteria bacterium]